MVDFAGGVGVRMRPVAALLFLFALLQVAPPPDFTATWQGRAAARVAWQQPEGVAITCLSRNTTLIRCWTNAPAGSYRVDLGGPLTDGALRPAAGDAYVLWQDGVVRKAPLRGVVLFPIMRR